MLTPLSRRRPWQVARQVLTLDHLSNGRVIFGAGLGGAMADFESFGEETNAKVRASMLDEGLEMTKNASGRPIGTEFDPDDLLRMDTATLVKASAEAIKGGGMSPNEARARYLELGPVAGGEAPYLQQQNFSLSALAKRDAQADPFSSAAPPPAEKDDVPDTDAELEAAGAGAWLTRRWEGVSLDA